MNYFVSLRKKLEVKVAAELLDQVRETIRLKHLSRRTEEAYIRWIHKFILFHNKRYPSSMGEAEIRSFFSSLRRHKFVSSSTQNQVSF